MSTKRNLVALEELRRVVAKAPDHLLHMRAVTEEAHCGTAHCAIGWAMQDRWFKQNTPFREGNWFTITGTASDVFGIDGTNVDRLLATGIESDCHEHAITKEEVLWNIDELLNGRDALPYRALVDDGQLKDEPNYEGPCAAGL